LHVLDLAAGSLPKLVDESQQAAALAACLLCLTEHLLRGCPDCLDEAPLLCDTIMDGVLHLLV
jgi:hypothetical protein